MQGSTLKIPSEKVSAHKDAERVLMWLGVNWAFPEWEPQGYASSPYHTCSQLAVGQCTQGSPSSCRILSVFRTKS